MLGSRRMLLVSTYVVCERLSVDAWACWSGWKFGPNSTVYPYSAIQNTPPRKIVKKSWHFDFSVAEYPPPPGKSKFPTFSLSPNPKLQITPPPLWKIQVSNFFPKTKSEVADYPPPKKGKLSEILALWLFSCRIPPPPHWNLGISWYFVIFRLQNTPPSRPHTILTHIHYAI